ncbi:hypothetical protein GCM10009838_71310 [Catenulispora subtropica]|uniref:Uncharacterized protein n=1 Tax=Catenulispora subtropica TaxID=450798 RepID=A0ABP5EDP1_9ACTN
MPTGLADVQEAPEASRAPATAPPPDSCAVTDVSFPLATLTWICEAGSASDVFAAGLITTTAAEDDDEDVLGAALDEEDAAPPAVGVPDPAAGFPTGFLEAFEPLPPPPHPPARATTATAAIVAASFCSLRIIASCARSYNWLIPMPPQRAVEPLGFP